MIINHIDDVWPIVKDHKEFMLLIKDGYQVIDYVNSIPNKTFPKRGDPSWELLRECRGLIFDSKGILISRPLHKAFNWGEYPSEDRLYKDKWLEAEVMDKLDGSLIRPLPLEGSWRLATRKGLTDVSAMAEAHLERSGEKKKYFDFFNYCWNLKITPIFEYCSRDNRVVIDHPEDKLVLLALRAMYSGIYLPHNLVLLMEHERGIPVCPIYRGLQREENDIDSFLNEIRMLKDAEGVVLRWPDGHMVKVKAEDYCNLHRTKSYIDNERSVVACILTDMMDDLYPLLSPSQNERVKKYHTQFWEGFFTSKEALEKYIEEGIQYATDRRTFAVDYVNHLPQQWRPILFWLNNNGLLNSDTDCGQVLKEFIKYGSQYQVNSSRWLFNAFW